MPPAGYRQRQFGYEIAIAFFYNSDRVWGIRECDRAVG